ncbi:MAG: hypothetical protein FJX75_23425 [Armatimonadetes bacterium]|nr:hypothetical protein [Armatimonadota bacterium]
MVALILALAVNGSAGVIFEDGFETLDARWTRNVTGDGTVEIVPGGVEGNCLKLSASGGMTYVSTQLDPQEYAGATIEVVGMVKLDSVQMGKEVFATAKFHIGATLPDKTVVNFADRWVGTADWAEKTLKADIPDNAQRIVLDLGIQNATGTAYYDSLVVRDTFGTGRPISLLPICNLGRSDGVANDGRGSFLDLGMNDLFSLPEGNLEVPGVTFTVPPDGVNMGKTCAILKGEQRPNLPAETDPLPVDVKARTLCFLQTAAWANVEAQEPCLAYEIEYADGEKATIEMTAGVDVANFDDPREFANCKLVWQGKNGAGKQVGVGMATWRNPRPEVAIKSLRIVSAGKGVPIVLAVSYLRK